MTERVENCEVITEITGASVHRDVGAPLPFRIPCGKSYVPYESLFERTRITGTIFVWREDNSPCGLAVIVESAEHEPITFSLAPETTNRVISLTVDCLRKITFSCTPPATPPPTVPPGGYFCTGTYSLQLRWCKCC